MNPDHVQKRDTLIAVLQDLFGPAHPVDVSGMTNKDKAEEIAKSCMALLAAMIWAISGHDVEDALAGVDAAATSMKKHIRSRP